MLALQKLMMNLAQMDYDYGTGAGMEYSREMDAETAAAVAGMMAFMGIIYMLLLGIYYISYGICLMKMGKRLNNDKTWMAWIPIVNLFYLADLAGKPMWWGILLLIPIVQIVIMVILFMEIAKKLNQGEWMGILAAILPMIIPVLGLIPLFMMAFSGGQSTGQTPPNPMPNQTA